MPTITQIIFDKRTNDYQVRMLDSTGRRLESKRRFATQVEAEMWLDGQLRAAGASRGQPMPLKGH